MIRSELDTHWNSKSRQQDGGLIVHRSARNDIEMAWRLYTWGDKVEVLSLKTLPSLSIPDACPGRRGRDVPRGGLPFSL
jgi:hypothetical protein